METIAKIITVFQPLTNFTIGPSLDVRFSCEYATEVILYHNKP